MKAMKLCAVIGIAGLLAACAQQEEPRIVAPEPVYDKVGGGSCEGDWIYVPGTVPERDECVPPDGCEPVYDTAGNIIDCLPPPRYPDPGSSDDDSSTSTRGTPGTPTGGPRT